MMAKWLTWNYEKNNDGKETDLKLQKTMMAKWLT